MQSHLKDLRLKTFTGYLEAEGYQRIESLQQLKHSILPKRLVPSSDLPAEEQIKQLHEIPSGFIKGKLMVQVREGKLVPVAKPLFNLNHYQFYVHIGDIEKLERDVVTIFVNGYPVFALTLESLKSLRAGDKAVTLPVSYYAAMGLFVNNVSTEYKPFKISAIGDRLPPVSRLTRAHPFFSKAQFTKLLTRGHSGTEEGFYIGSYRSYEQHPKDPVWNDALTYLEPKTVAELLKTLNFPTELLRKLAPYLRPTDPEEFDLIFKHPSYDVTVLQHIVTTSQGVSLQALAFYDGLSPSEVDFLYSSTKDSFQNITVALLSRPGLEDYKAKQMIEGCDFANYFVSKDLLKDAIKKATWDVTLYNPVLCSSSANGEKLRECMLEALSEDELLVRKFENILVDAYDIDPEHVKLLPVDTLLTYMMRVNETAEVE